MSYNNLGFVCWILFKHSNIHALLMKRGSFLGHHITETNNLICEAIMCNISFHVFHEFVVKCNFSNCAIANSSWNIYRRKIKSYKLHWWFTCLALWTALVIYICSKLWFVKKSEGSMAFLVPWPCVAIMELILWNHWLVSMLRMSWFICVPVRWLESSSGSVHYNCLHMQLWEGGWYSLWLDMFHCSFIYLSIEASHHKSLLFSWFLLPYIGVLSSWITRVVVLTMFWRISLSLATGY